VPLTPRPVK